MINLGSIVTISLTVVQTTRKEVTKLLPSFDTAEKEPGQISCKIRDREPCFGMVSALDLKVPRALHRAITALVFIV